MKRRTLLSLFAAAIASATVFGFAASLGAISGNQIGAGNGAVGSCDTDGVATAYTSAWDATDKRYEVTGVVVSGIADACDGKTLKAALADSTNASLGDGSVTIPTGAATSATVSSLSSNPAAAAVQNVHIVIGD